MRRRDFVKAAGLLLPDLALARPFHGGIWNGSSSGVGFNPGFPRSALIAVGGPGGNQWFAYNGAYTYPSPVTALASKFSLAILGATWEGSGSSSRKKDSLVKAIKQNSVAPSGTLVFLYAMAFEVTPTAPLTLWSLGGNQFNPGATPPTDVQGTTSAYAGGEEHYALEISTNNWWAYENGFSGSYYFDAFNETPVRTAYNYANGAPFAGRDSSGDGPMEYFAKYCWSELLTGVPVDSRFNWVTSYYDYSPSADGIFFDILLRNIPNSLAITADETGAGGHAPDSYDGTVCDYLSAGHYQLFKTLQSLASAAGRTIYNFGNIGDYAISTSTGVAPYDMHGVLNGGVLESVIGLSNSWDSDGVLDGYLATIVSRISSPNLVTVDAKYFGSQLSVPAGVIPANLYQVMRYGLACACLYGCLFSFELKSAEYDIGTNGANIQWFDEYDNAAAQQGWLGYPVSGPTGAVGGFTGAVTSTYSGLHFALPSGVTGREFQTGLVLRNAWNGTIGVTVTAANLGGSGIWRRINGTQVPSINNGQLVTTSVSLGANSSARDGLFLLRA